METPVTLPQPVPGGPLTHQPGDEAAEARNQETAHQARTHVPARPASEPKVGSRLLPFGVTAGGQPFEFRSPLMEGRAGSTPPIEFPASKTTYQAGRRSDETQEAIDTRQTQSTSPADKLTVQAPWDELRVEVESSLGDAVTVIRDCVKEHFDALSTDHDAKADQRVAKLQKAILSQFETSMASVRDEHVKLDALFTDYDAKADERMAKVQVAILSQFNINTSIANVRDEQAKLDQKIFDYLNGFNQRFYTLEQSFNRLCVDHQQAYTVHRDDHHKTIEQIELVMHSDKGLAGRFDESFGKHSAQMGSLIDARISTFLATHPQPQTTVQSGVEGLKRISEDSRRKDHELARGMTAKFDEHRDQVNSLVASHIDTLLATQQQGFARGLTEYRDQISALAESHSEHQ